MWFVKPPQIKPTIGESIRAICRDDNQRKKLYEMENSSVKEFKVDGKTVRIAAGGDGAKVVRIRR